MKPRWRPARAIPGGCGRRRRSESMDWPVGRTGTALSLIAMAGCGRPIDALNAAGPQAGRIADLTLLMVALGAAVYVVVIGAMLYAARRGARRRQVAAGAAVEHQMTRWVGGAVGATVVVLLVLLALNFRTGRALASFGDADAITIQVVGQQWWWHVEYMDPAPSRRLITANEIHVPVGRRIRLLTQSRDVIHSFWAPNVHGKIDLIPGYGGTTYFQVDEPGIYYGRCAEFCGHQHAHMGFTVVAQPQAEFESWYRAQLLPAPFPADSARQAGQEVFLSRGCVMCHTVRGTPAASRVGPDLTHIGSRRTLAAGTLPNTPEHLASWVLDPQAIKPGVLMPPNRLSPAELAALISYLQGLR